MTHCVVCGQPCTPLADYDYPVCHRCDAYGPDALQRTAPGPAPNAALKALAAQITAETYARRVPEYRADDHAGEGAADRERLARLLRDMDTPTLRVIEGGAA